MKWFYNLKIGTKLVSSFIIVALIGAIVGGIGIFSLQTIDKADTALYEENTLGLVYMVNATLDFEVLRANTINLGMSGKNKDDYVSQIQESYKNLNDDLTKYEKTITADDDRKEFNNLKSLTANYKSIIDKIASLISSNQNEQSSNILDSEAAPAAKLLDNSFRKIVDINEAQAKQSSDSVAATTKNTIMIMIIALIIAIAVSIILGIFLSSIISKPIKKLVDAANKISIGDLDVTLKIDTKDEVGILAKAFNKIIVSLNNLITDTNMLAQAAVEGKLDTRADAGKHNGDYRKIVEGLNNTLDAVVEPLNEADQVLAKMSVNDYTVEMSDRYKGMFKEFADSINSVHARLLSVQDVFVRCSKGDVSLLEQYQKVGKRSENDRMVPACVAMMGAIQDLTNESNTLANAAVNGDLSIRGDAGKFEGGYKEIIKGMNYTMDAVVEPIQEASAVLRQTAEGNMTMVMEGDYKGEYSKFKESLNHAINSFNDVLNDINNAADQVASGSSQVSDGSQELSQGATEQASSIEELTASIEEIAAQTKQNAVNANQANELAINAKDNAIQGNGQMKQMLSSMAEINEASSNIFKIIKVIDEIAFQTNILALNAAVEAARAGQHGKGFAVVAEEVRNLAARSANAAKETTALIEGSIKKAEAGTKIANDTAKALNSIVEEVNKAATLVGEIAIASNEQATGVAQINKGIEQVSQVVQTNSATSEEAAAASEELSSQAELLKEMVGRFKLKKAKVRSRYELSDEEDMAPADSYELRRKAIGGMGKKSAMAEAAATSLKPRIALSDKEFGKY